MTGLLTAALALGFAIVTPLADPAQESRAQALEQEIRCVVCENEPISQSTADIAEDMRKLVRERIAAGESDAEIRKFFSDRYGDFVLLRPGFNASTLALWLGPLLIGLIGVALAAGAFRKESRAGAADEAPAPHLDPDDR